VCFVNRGVVWLVEFVFEMVGLKEDLGGQGEGHTCAKLWWGEAGFPKNLFEKQKIENLID
jgi:hypothetical protein